MNTLCDVGRTWGWDGGGSRFGLSGHPASDPGEGQCSLRLGVVGSAWCSPGGRIPCAVQPTGPGSHHRLCPSYPTWGLAPRKGGTAECAYYLQVRPKTIFFKFQQLAPADLGAPRARRKATHRHVVLSASIIYLHLVLYPHVVAYLRSWLVSLSFAHWTVTILCMLGPAFCGTTIACPDPPHNIARMPKNWARWKFRSSQEQDENAFSCGNC